MKPFALKKPHFFNTADALHKLLFASILGLLAYFILMNWHMQALTRIMCGWNVFSCTMIVMSLITFFHTSSEDIRREVKGQDVSRYMILLIVLVSAFCSLLAVIILLSDKDENALNRDLHTPVSLLGMALSWVLIHTIFTFRYGHLFYGDDEDQPATHAGGLDFPGEKTPDYVDFAYFSFVIGMTFQVSDVQITSTNIRRLVLLHGILSFGYNTVLVALTINVVASLR